MKMIQLVSPAAIDIHPSCLITTMPYRPKKKSAGFEHADFPLRYNFPPLSIRITSWIVKKKVSLEEMVRKKS